MKNTIMYAYKNTSAGAILLAKKMGIKKMNHGDSTWRPGPDKVVLNWGSGGYPYDVKRAGRIINNESAVNRAINKIEAFDTFVRAAAGPRTPEWTLRADVAKRWLYDGSTVLARTRVEGARGEGIIVMKNIVDFVDARLYTKYIDKDAEFRVHVIGGEAVFLQQRIRDPKQNVKDWHVRSDENGFIMVNRITPVPDDIKVQSIRAVTSLGLDFGAVDIVMKDERGYVLEVNTAPWLNQEVSDVYAQKLATLIGD